MGVYIEGDDAIVRNNIIHHSGAAVQVLNGASCALVFQNDVYTTSLGIYAALNTTNSGLSIEGNTVHGNGSGITVFGSGLVIDNLVYSNVGGTGIQVNGSNSEARENTVYGNRIGIRPGGGAVARGNRVYANTELGFYMELASAFDNIIYSNPTGIAVTVDSMSSRIMFSTAIRCSASINRITPA